MVQRGCRREDSTSGEKCRERTIERRRIHHWKFLIGIWRLHFILADPFGFSRLFFCSLWSYLHGSLSLGGRKEMPRRDFLCLALTRLALLSALVAVMLSTYLCLPDTLMYLSSIRRCIYPSNQYLPVSLQSILNGLSVCMRACVRRRQGSTVWTKETTRPSPRASKDSLKNVTMTRYVKKYTLIFLSSLVYLQCIYLWSIYLSLM